MDKCPTCDCTHNILHLYTQRMDTVWRYEQYMKDAKKEGHEACAAFLEELYTHDIAALEKLRKAVVEKAKKGLK